MTQAKIANRQNRYRPNPEQCRKLLEWFLRCSRRVFPQGATPLGEVTVLLVGHKSIAGAHRAVFGKKGSTDVISMVYAPLPGLDVGGSAELLVNVERAVEEGRKRASEAWGPSHELALYMAHGVDHLTGADDALPADRRRMRSREVRWVRSADRTGLLRGLLRVRVKPNEPGTARAGKDRETVHG